MAFVFEERDSVLFHIRKSNNDRLVKTEFIGRGGSWLDTGNIKDFNDASNFIATIESRQGLKIEFIGRGDKKKLRKCIKYYMHQKKKKNKKNIDISNNVIT